MTCAIDAMENCIVEYKKLDFTIEVLNDQLTTSQVHNPKKSSFRLFKVESLQTSFKLQSPINATAVNLLGHITAPVAIFTLTGEVDHYNTIQCFSS